jgi:two-component system sensor histidine kinase/response regulator
MGGDAGAESTPGSGQPLLVHRLAGAHRAGQEPPKMAAGISAADLRRRHAGARILLVEDNPVNREVATELLQDAGLVVEPAENGRVAVDKLPRRSLRLVLMDMQMPEMDGLEANAGHPHLPMPEGRQRADHRAMTANAFDEELAAMPAWRPA